MYAVLSCLQSHDPHLVLWAACICVVGCAASFSAYRKALLAEGGLRLTWLTIMAGLLGCAVWSTHFMAMLAYQPGFELRFDIWLTVASLALAIVGLGGGATLAIWNPTTFGRAVGGGLCGAAVCGMHFTGVAALRLPAEVDWNGGLVALAMAQGVGLAAAAFITAGDLFKLPRGIAATLLLVLAICGLHFTAMGAAVLIPNGQPFATSGEAPENLALGLGALAAVVLVAGCGVIMLERFSKLSVLNGLRSALGQAPSAIAFFDRDHRLIFWNESYGSVVRSYGIEPKRGERFLEIIQTASRAGLPADIVEAAIRRTSILAQPSETGQFQTPDGRWLQSNMGSTNDGGFVVVLTDVTQQLALTEREATARRSAEDASRAKSEFLANMSHEIRTPLNGVIGMVQVLGREPLTPQQRECLEVIDRSSGALLTVLNQVLDLSKIESGKIDLEEAPFDLDDVVRVACGAYAFVATDKSLSLDIAIDAAASGSWIGDAGRVRQVLANLVSNALKFTSVGGVTVRVEAAAGGVAFTVTDTGMGIAPEHHDRVFLKFTQADSSTTRRFGGTGLGLAICRDLVELMGGRLELQSALGVGSTFTFILPLRRAIEAAPQQPAVEHGQAELGALRILAAEDNPTNQRVLAALLGPLDPHLVFVDDGRQALEAYQHAVFDLVLMDAQMPEMNGTDATRAIRQFERANGRRRTPIIALTANVMKHQLEGYAAAGMDGHVGKPLQAELLFAEIERVLDEVELRAAS